MVKLCACGCGLETKNDSNFINHHNLRILAKKWKKDNPYGIERAKHLSDMKKGVPRQWTEEWKRNLHTSVTGREKTTEERKQISARMKQFWTVEKRYHHSEYLSNMWKDDPERFENSLQALERAKKTPRRKKEKTFDTNDYDDEFGLNKEKVLDRDSHECVICNAFDDLVVHHIDAIKTHSEMNNLITLCRACHIVIHTDKINRRWWMSILSRIDSMSHKSIICGIDPGTHSLGMSFFFKDGEYIGSLSIQSNDGDAKKRLYWMLKKITRYLLLLKPNIVFIEEPIYIQSFIATSLLSEICGAIKTFCIYYGIEYQGVKNQVWKKYVVGKGNATKSEIMTYALANIDSQIEVQDEADAMCIAYYGLKKEQEAYGKQS